jgi:hypothetical protein
MNVVAPLFHAAENKLECLYLACGSNVSKARTIIMGKLKLTGRNLGRVFNSRLGHAVQLYA